MDESRQAEVYRQWKHDQIQVCMGYTTMDISHVYEPQYVSYSCFLYQRKTRARAPSLSEAVVTMIIGDDLTEDPASASNALSSIEMQSTQVVVAEAVAFSDVSGETRLNRGPATASVIDGQMSCSMTSSEHYNATTKPGDVIISIDTDSGAEHLSGNTHVRPDIALTVAPQELSAQVPTVTQLLKLSDFGLDVNRRFQTVVIENPNFAAPPPADNAEMHTSATPP